MRTDDLIESLSERLEPTSPRAPLRWLALYLTIGAAISAVLMLVVLGPRPDLMPAMKTSMFWTKFGYTLALGGLALWAAERLGRPGASATRPWGRLTALIVVFALGAAWKLMAMPADERMPAVMGHSARLCPCYILALSVPVLVAAMLAMRRFAPTRPALAGLAAGLAAGGLGAFVYAFSCNESAMPFVALWYTLPVLVAGALGALIGRFALRW